MCWVYFKQVLSCPNSVPIICVRSVLGILECSAPTPPYQMEPDRPYIHILVYYCASPITRNLAAQIIEYVWYFGYVSNVFSVVPILSQLCVFVRFWVYCNMAPLHPPIRRNLTAHIFKYYYIIAHPLSALFCESRLREARPEDSRNSRSGPNQVRWHTRCPSGSMHQDCWGRQASRKYCLSIPKHQSCNASFGLHHLNFSWRPLRFEDCCVAAPVLDRAVLLYLPRLHSEDWISSRATPWIYFLSPRAPGTNKTWTSRVINQPLGPPIFLWNSTSTRGEAIRRSAAQGAPRRETWDKIYRAVILATSFGVFCSSLSFGLGTRIAGILRSW